MNSLKRLLFVVGIIPLILFYMLGGVLSIVLLIPYWIITGKSLIVIHDNIGDKLFVKFKKFLREQGGS